VLEASPARVVLVSAPAGWGKTVLALEWLADGSDRAAWFSVDALDNDPVRFFAHLGAALDRVETPAFRAAAAVLAERSPTSSRDPSAEVLAALAAAPEGHSIVLDDIHLLETPRAWTFLGRLVADGPPEVRLVLLSREDPPLRLARLRVTGELLEVRERELRFTEEEAESFFGHVGPSGLDPESVARLVERTEGWAAGLRLASAALEVAPDPTAAAESFGGRHELLVDYLLEEALRGRSPEVQRFLMETSVLPRFTGETCRAVTGDGRAAEHLRGVEEANLFLTSLDGEGRWYRYHHLFAELLTFRLERLDPGRVPVLRRRASAWFERRGELPEALALAAELPESDLLVRILDRHGYPMLARSEFAAFERWLRAVPDPAAYGWPMFLAAVSWFHVQVDVGADLERWLDRLDRAVGDPPPDYPAGALAEARIHREVIRAFGLRIRGRMEEALETAGRILEPAPPASPVLRGITEFHVAAVRMRLGEMPEARAFLQRAAETTRRGHAPYIFLASLGHLGAVRAQLEGVPDAVRHLEEARALAEARRLEGLPAFGIVLYQLADTLILADERKEARHYLEQALEITHHERRTDIHGNVLVRLARLDAWAGDVDRAEERLAEAAVVSRGQSLKPFGTSIEIERARLDQLTSGRLLEPSADLVSDAVVGERWTIVREAEAMLRMQQALLDGRDADADRLARRLEAESRPRERGVALCLALLTRAAVTGDAAERHRRLQAALALAERRRYVRPLLDGGGPIRSLLETGLRGSLDDRVRAFVRERLLPELPPAARRPPPGDLGLTPREREILAHLARGLTNKELARTLFVSENTVKTHLKHVFAKLDVSTRTAAVQRGRRLGLLEGPAG
jgi:LuxR family maltose regulon positive regulatory protein